ncbi:MAG: glutamine--fructose-6-phosphate transaminase (isomerizing) [Holosporales bacterium]|jgi:glucosamine--fructose-6-phosphate aminotransferase (isomerizing)|nr:glutamine--fructose-6-phosphate transaminase (isomerizing) [Holosporales bacterium]
MCGIIAAISRDDGLENAVISALERLEYRGYDSAGIAYLDRNQPVLCRIRATGRIENLKRKIAQRHIDGTIGIGHTRWATHGGVTEENAHPHACNGVAIVHNGIIENYQQLKERLKRNGYCFDSETDSEVIATLIAYNISDGLDFTGAFLKSIRELTGTYAIVAIHEKEPNTLLGAKNGSPMTVGLSPDGMNFYVASDAVALSSLAENIAYLEDGDCIIAENSDPAIAYKILDKSENEVVRQVVPNSISLKSVNKGGYETFMLKEIFEEAVVAAATYDGLDCNVDITKYGAISIIACGTSYYAGLLAKYFIEELAQIHVDVEVASEFRYRNPVLSPNSLYVFISQSGETIDTLCAMRLVKQRGYKTLALINVDGSSIAREADIVIKTASGIEIGVAATKTFIAQSLSMLMLCQKKEDIKMDQITSSINAVLNNCQQIANAAEKMKGSKGLVYIGRGISYPIALEGALKIKELAYISAEGYPAGEIKHGPIAIVDEDVYTISIAPYDKHFEKTISNTQEILARNGKILLITTKNSAGAVAGIVDHDNVDVLFLCDVEWPYQAFCMATAIHLLAYYTSKAKGHDVDKPRNLAKSVTVE